MNTAARLSDLFDSFVNKGWANDTPLVKVWADVFGLPPDSSQLEDNVVTCIQSVRLELDLLQSKLSALGVPEDLMHPGFARFREFSSAKYLGHQWVSHKDEIKKPENAIPFKWATWALRDESENVLADEELREFREELDALERSLQETEMAPYLRSFVQRQIEAIRSAFLVYRVRGVAPLETALKQVAGDCAVERPRLETENATASEPAKGILARAGVLIEKAAKVADHLDKFRKAGEGAYSLVVAVTPTLSVWSHKLLTAASS